MDWYQKAFGEDYLKIYSHRNSKEAKQLVDFIYKALELKKGQMVLDLGSGYGRNAIELAQKKMRVYCLDLSPVLIHMAKELAQDKGLDLQYIRADMRHTPFKKCFDVIVSLFTSFGYFEKEMDNLRVLKNVQCALKPKGLFLLDYLNVKHSLFNMVPKDFKREKGFNVIQERYFDSQNERIKKKITINGDSGIREYNESVRAYGIIELATMFADSGLKCIASYGDYFGSPYTPDSPRLIMIGQKE